MSLKTVLRPSLLRPGLASALILAAGAASAQSEPPSAPPPAPPPTQAAPATAPVESQALRAPDLFSADAGQPTGLPSDLWKGTSLGLMRTVLPIVAVRPMSPAAQAFARRLMATSAAAPEGGGSDPDLAALRINVVLSLGDPIGARAMLEHTPGVRQSAALSQVAAEADLLIDREDEACGLADNLAAGKDGPYFRRLRAYCLFKAGDKAGAQLAYDLTAEQAKDDIYKRLMGAAVTGGPPGEASLRNGIEYALSRRLGLDLTPAIDKAWAPVVTTIARDSSNQAAAQAAAASRLARRAADMNAASTLNPAVRDAALSLADNKLTPQLSERLAAAGASGSMEAQQALALYAAAGALGSEAARAALATFDIGPTRANQARMLELDSAGSGGAKGDVALLALWLASDAGEAGMLPADRARVVRVLNRSGFGADARGFALEGLLALQPPPPPPPPPPPKPVKKPAKKRSGH